MLLTHATEKALSRGLLDVLIRAGLIAALVIFCFEIFRPFFNLVIWSPILATTIYPLQVAVGKGSAFSRPQPYEGKCRRQYHRPYDGSKNGRRSRSKMTSAAISQRAR